MHSPDHPIWKILHDAVYLTAAGVGLYLFANHFDESEVKSLAFMIAAVGGYRGIESTWKKFKGTTNG